MRIVDITQAIENELPLYLQESYDNSGYQVGNPQDEATGGLLCVDVTEAVIEEAIERGCNLIIAHHPLLFKPLKSIVGKTYIERCVIRAIQAGVTIYAAHTNADNAGQGLNQLIAEAFGLKNVRILSPMQSPLLQLTTYVPHAYADRVRKALWNAGAGAVGKYDSCSFNLSGTGTFRASTQANPFVGEIGQIHSEPETLISTVLHQSNKARVLSALLETHPYETPAFSFITLEGIDPDNGAGVIGELAEPMLLQDFLLKARDLFNSNQLRYSIGGKETVSRIAICGGAGAFLWSDARKQGADLLLTGEAKYNDYFDVEGNPTLLTVGHYESERIATQLFHSIISKKFPTFAVHESHLDSNPIRSL